ncbi:hypothetical protein JCM8547_008180 [Rhodosporidiobolus lusitaniae]
MSAPSRTPRNPYDQAPPTSPSFRIQATHSRIAQQRSQSILSFRASPPTLPPGVIEHYRNALPPRYRALVEQMPVDTEERLLRRDLKIHEATETEGDLIAQGKGREAREVGREIVRLRQEQRADWAEAVRTVQVATQEDWSTQTLQYGHNNGLAASPPPEQPSFWDWLRPYFPAARGRAESFGQS